MSGSFGEMGNLLQQAQRMQKALDEARAELREATVEGSAGGGVVRVVVRGDGMVESIEITDEALEAKDRQILQELVLAAVRDGIQRASRLSEERLSKVTGGLNLPGFM